MTLKLRFSLILIGVVIFLIAGPIIVLFARGFLIDFKHGKIIKTGTIIAKTQPAKAQIFLNNDTKSRANTPTIIRFLIPGDYVVTIKKDKYQAWTKRLTVNAQLITNVNLNRDYTALFFIQPNLKQSTTTDSIWESKNKKELAYIKNKRLYRINIDNSQENDLGPIPNLEQIKAYVQILDWTNAAAVYALAQNLLASTLNLTPSQIAQTSQIETNGTYFAAISNGQLYGSNNGNLKLIDSSVQGFTLDGEDVWYLKDTRLIKANLSTTSYQTVYSSLPVFANAEIIRASGHVFLNLDKTLYVLNDQLEKIYSPVTYAAYDPNSDKLLLANNNELMLYDTGTKQSELFLRSVSKIDKAVLNWETGYVFFQNEGKIKAIELDGRDHRNVYDILDVGAAPVNFALSDDGKTLYTFTNAEIKSYQIR